jgi:hypothetical protein
MKQRILSGWNFRRVMYLLLGIALIAQSIMIQQWMGIFIGAYFAAMGIFSFGCAAGNCYTNNTHQTKNKVEDITYQEVK